ncbi:hypothetical protein N7G274_007712 [Stereocaulon virgatum]|uniref:Uncharacterized protein n=1 Tax=Stereocaulon virgatum TaxID=373712 RepID=A0ABR4A0P7_9LECA
MAQHRDKLHSVKLHLEHGCNGHIVVDYNTRGYEAMRRTLSLLLSSKTLLTSSLDTDWMRDDEICEHLMANGSDQLRKIEYRGDVVHDDNKADQGKSERETETVSPLDPFSARIVPIYGPSGPRKPTL